MAEGKNGREILTTMFLDISKMSILPFARGSFENMKRETQKIGFVTIMLSKRVFCLKNMWLYFFEGVGWNKDASI